jgi:hypothetical protein
VLRATRSTSECADLPRVFLLTVAVALGASPALLAAAANPGLIGIVYGDTEMARPAERISVPRLDERIPEWPKQRDGGLRILGSVTAPVSGPVEFRIETAHRAHFWLGGRKIVDSGSDGASASFVFSANEPVRLRVEYVQPGMPSLMRVSWRLPGDNFEPVPESALSHDNSDLAAADAAGARPGREDLLAVTNPDPTRLASLRVWRTPKELLVEASIPSVPGFTCNSWCYEGGMEYESCRDLGDGRLELRHRLTATPEVLVVTTVTPGWDRVEFLARLVREDGRDGPFPESPHAPNLCWQLKASPEFASMPESYPSFFARCFIFTEHGLTFLNNTTRRKIPAKPADAPENNPPWVQIFGPANEPPKRSEPGAWADYSTARFVHPVVGTVSRDRRHLVAIASPSAKSLCQAWHDCMHINSNWDTTDRTWRLTIYAMENDPTKLLEAVKRDFAVVR